MFTNRPFYPLIMITLLVFTACTPAPTRSSARFLQWHTADALQAFHAAGLQIEIPQLSKDERDVFSSELALESRQFVIPVQGEPSLARGVIFGFQNERDLQMVRDYYESLGKSLPRYSSWLFVKDNLLLQINREVPEDVARQYAAALNLLDAP